MRASVFTLLVVVTLARAGEELPPVPGPIARGMERGDLAAVLVPMRVRTLEDGESAGVLRAYLGSVAETGDADDLEALYRLAAMEMKQLEADYAIEADYTYPYEPMFAAYVAITRRVHEEEGPLLETLCRLVDPRIEEPMVTFALMHLLREGGQDREGRLNALARALNDLPDEVPVARLFSFAANLGRCLERHEDARVVIEKVLGDARAGNLYARVLDLKLSGMRGDLERVYRMASEMCRKAAADGADGDPDQFGLFRHVVITAVRTGKRSAAERKFLLDMAMILLDHAALDGADRYEASWRAVIILLAPYQRVGDKGDAEVAAVYDAVLKRPMPEITGEDCPIDNTSVLVRELEAVRCMVMTYDEVLVMRGRKKRGLRIQCTFGDDLLKE